MKLEPWYHAAVAMLKPPMFLVTSRSWHGHDFIPATGGCIVAANHISNFDPLVMAYFLHERRHPRFMGKESVFKIPFAGDMLRSAGQIPVKRGSADAIKSLHAAIEAVQAGECVVIYPEGTISRDPNLWPMRGRTGVARLALVTGAPVIPVAQWGAQKVMPYPSLVPRGVPPWPVKAAAGPPVDLRRWQGVDQTPEVLAEVAEAVMSDIQWLLEGLRGEIGPQTRFVPSSKG